MTTNFMGGLDHRPGERFNNVGRLFVIHGFLVAWAWYALLAG